MNTIFIKQSIKVKVNKRDTTKAIVNKIAQLLKEDETSIEYTVIQNNEIGGLASAGSVVIITNKKHDKYFAATVGASTHDVWCVLSDNTDGTYCFEYILEIDKKIFKDIELSRLSENMRDNKDLMEVLHMMGGLASAARYNSLLSNSHGKIAGNEDNRYSGIFVTDFTDSDNNDVETDVIGRKGKLHLFRVVPALKDEIEIADYLEDATMNSLIVYKMIKNKMGTFSNRKKSFNFAEVLPVDNITDDKWKSIKVKLDKDNKPVINTAKQVEDFLDILE